jgi:hypothetical protein
MTTPDQNYESLKAVYKVCIETRNFEINQLIQRNNFFMLFQGVLLAAALQNQGSKPAVELIICLTGIFVSIYQLQMASGAKYWQEWWESRLEEYEQKLGEHQDANDASFHDLFTASSDKVHSVISERLRRKSKGKLSNLLILQAYQVGRAPIKVSLVLTLAWLMLTLHCIDFSSIPLPPGLVKGFTFAAQPK